MRQVFAAHQIIIALGTTNLFTGEPLGALDPSDADNSLDPSQQNDNQSPSYQQRQDVHDQSQSKADQWNAQQQSQTTWSAKNASETNSGTGLLGRFWNEMANTGIMVRNGKLQTVNLQNLPHVQSDAELSTPELYFLGAMDGVKLGAAMGNFLLDEAAQGIAKMSQYAGKYDDFWSKAADYVERKSGPLTADEANQFYIEQGMRSPYGATRARDILLQNETTFLHVYADEDEPAGRWLMRPEELENLTAQQIQDKFSLPTLPKYMTDVQVPANTQLRLGITATQQGWGMGGGIQYELLDDIPKMAYQNGRPLNELEEIYSEEREFTHSP